MKESGSISHGVWKSACLLVVLGTLLTACASPAGPLAASAPKASVAAPRTPSPALPDHRPVTFATTDHLTLAGWLWAGGGNIALICAHERAGDKSNWADAAPRLAAHGYNVLAFDFRGYGNSAGPYDRSHLDLDMLAAIAFMRAQGAHKVIVLGASLGAIVSLMVAARAHIDGVISLSGGYYSYQAPPTLTQQEVQAITVPKLFVASRDDPFAVETQMVYQDAVQPKALQVYAGSEHGTQIFAGPNGPDLYARILAFVQGIVSGER